MALETLKDVKEIGGFKIAHLEKAIPKDEYLELIKSTFIIHGKENNTLIFKIQDGPIKENGVNGCQVTDALRVLIHIYEGLQKKFPCAENQKTINKLKEGLFWQDERTKDRKARGVEGTSNE